MSNFIPLFDQLIETTSLLTEEGKRQLKTEFPRLKEKTQKAILSELWIEAAEKDTLNNKYFSTLLSHYIPDSKNTSQ